MAPLEVVEAAHDTRRVKLDRRRREKHCALPVAMREGSLRRRRASPSGDVGGIYLDARHRILSEREIFVGTLSSASVSPRDVFRFALNAHAAAVIVFHNHPSGDPSPSPQDLAFTAKLVGIGQPLGVEVLDHLIVTSSAFVSFRQRNLL